MSLKSNVAVLAEKMLSDFVDDKKMFTAYDVTLSLRNQYLNVFHADVKYFVENKFFDHALTGYIRSPHPSISGLPNVYMPEGSNASDYVSPVSIYSGVYTPAGLTPAGLGFILSAPSALVQPVVISSNAQLSTDSKNRVRVTKELLESIGVKPFECVKVSVQSTSGTITISRDVSQMQSCKENLYVDGYPNLRIALTKRGIAAPKGFQVTKNSNELVLKPVI